MSLASLASLVSLVSLVVRTDVCPDVRKDVLKDIRTDGRPDVHTDAIQYEEILLNNYRWLTKIMGKRR